jgi:hypothetical protein
MAYILLALVPQLLSEKHKHMQEEGFGVYFFLFAIIAGRPKPELKYCFYSGQGHGHGVY